MWNIFYGVLRFIENFIKNQSLIVISLIEEGTQNAVREMVLVWSATALDTRVSQAMIERAMISFA